MPPRHLATTLCLLAATCAEPPPPNSASSPWITRDVGSPSEVTIRLGAGDGYRIIACPPRTKGIGIIGIIGTGRFPVPSEYPIDYNVRQHLAVALGSAVVDITPGPSCDKDSGRGAARILVRSYRDIDEVARKTAAFLHENDLDFHCMITLAADTDIKRPRRSLQYKEDRDVGTIADIHTQPGTFDGYSVRRCTHNGILGIDGTAPDLPPKDQDFFALTRRVEAFMKPLGAGVGWQVGGCTTNDLTIVISVEHLREVDATIARAGQFLRDNKANIPMIISVITTSQDMGTTAKP